MNIGKRVIVTGSLVIFIFVLVRPIVAQENSNKCEEAAQTGMSHYWLAQYDEALAQLQQANTCYQNIGDQTGQSMVLNLIGLVHSAQGRYDEALASYQDALEIVRTLENLDGERAIINNIGQIYLNQGQHLKALQYFQQALALAKSGDDRESEGAALNNIGMVYNAQGRYQAALDSYQQALVISQELEFASGQATVLSNIGSVYTNLGRYEAALESYQRALKISRSIGDRASEGINLSNIGGVYQHQGRLAEALSNYQQALVISREIGDRATEASTLSNIGALQSDQGRHTAGLESCQVALKISREIGNRAGEGVTLNNIGAIYNARGQYYEAGRAYQQALSISREVGDRLGEGRTLNNIGLLYLAQSNYVEALTTLQQALTIDRDLGNRAGEAVVLNNIGSIYHAQNRRNEALAYYRQALTIFQDIGDQSQTGKSLNNIGGIYDNNGQHDEARSYYRQAMNIFHEIGAANQGAVAMNNLAAIYRAEGLYEQALEIHHLALPLFQEIGDRQMEATTLNNIGITYDYLGHYPEALTAYQQSLDIDREINDPDGEARTLSNIAEVYQAQGSQAEALAYYRQALAILEDIRATAGSEAGRAEFVAQYIGVYRNLIDLLYRQQQPGLAFFTIEQSRSRAFLDSLATGQVNLQDNYAAELLIQEQERYAQRQALRFELAEVKVNAPEHAGELEQRLAEAEAAYEETQQAIAARGAELAALVPGRSADTVLGVQQVQLLLDEQTTLVAYYVLEDKLLAFILTANGFDTVALDVDPSDVTQQINAFRDFANLTESHPTSVVALYEMLIAPLKDHLTTPHLAIIPHQQLHYLPFAALTDGDRHLIDDYTLTVLPSASTLPFIQDNAQQTAFSDQPSALILGNPVTADYDTVASLATTRDSLGSLPYAEKEAKAIAKLFGVEPLIGEAATESVVREQVAEANILHLAAHGQFNPVAPLNSLIALAPDDKNDGWLTVGESYGLNLENTDLVVLSACETNLGDLSAGDELVGLTRALIFAGTPSVIASLWAVEDEATSLLMERFYTHLKDGVGKAEALRQAQIEVREEYPNPYYWSGFVLSGDPGEIEPRSIASNEVEAPSLTDAVEQDANSDDEQAEGVDETFGTQMESDASIETAPQDEDSSSNSTGSSGCLTLLLPLALLSAVGMRGKYPRRRQ